MMAGEPVTCSSVGCDGWPSDSGSGPRSGKGGQDGTGMTCPVSRRSARQGTSLGWALVSRRDLSCESWPYGMTCGGSSVWSGSPP